MRVKAETFEGNPCKACGETERYTLSGSCRNCNIEKSKRNRSLYKDVELGYRREYNWSRHGIDLVYSDFLVIMDIQGNKCALCGCDIKGKGNSNVDHDHNSGKIRGILCRICNTFMGRLDRIGIKKVVEYKLGRKIA